MPAHAFALICADEAISLADLSILFKMSRAEVRKTIDESPILELVDFPRSVTVRWGEHPSKYPRRLRKRAIAARGLLTDKPVAEVAQMIRDAGINVPELLSVLQTEVTHAILLDPETLRHIADTRENAVYLPLLRCLMGNMGMGMVTQAFAEAPPLPKILASNAPTETKVEMLAELLKNLGNDTIVDCVLRTNRTLRALLTISDQPSSVAANLKSHWTPESIEDLRDRLRTEPDATDIGEQMRRAKFSDIKSVLKTFSPSFLLAGHAHDTIVDWVRENLSPDELLNCTNLAELAHQIVERKPELARRIASELIDKA